VKYLHRRWRDADLYFFFNESDQPQTRQATLSGGGPVRVWDANAGTIGPADNTAAGNGTVRLRLELEPFGTRFIVVGAVPPATVDKR
jgi:hypothetical protein